MSDLSQTTSPPRSVDPWSRLGRRAGLVVYWVFALYVCGTGFWSIIPQVFGDGAETAAPTREDLP